MQHFPVDFDASRHVHAGPLGCHSEETFKPLEVDPAMSIVSGFHSDISGGVGRHE
jgi:hypothetical protein